MQIRLKYMFFFTNCLYFPILKAHIYSLISMKSLYCLLFLKIFYLRTLDFSDTWKGWKKMFLALSNSNLLFIFMYFSSRYRIGLRTLGRIFAFWIFWAVIEEEKKSLFLQLLSWNLKYAVIKTDRIDCI